MSADEERQFRDGVRFDSLIWDAQESPAAVVEDARVVVERALDAVGRERADLDRRTAELARAGREAGIGVTAMAAKLGVSENVVRRMVEGAKRRGSR